MENIYQMPTLQRRPSTTSGYHYEPQSSLFRRLIAEFLIYAIRHQCCARHHSKSSLYQRVISDTSSTSPIASK